MAPRVLCVSDPSRAEFVALVDECRERGAVRVSWGSFSAEFARPHEKPHRELPTEQLTAAERAELEQARERKLLAEELGNG